MKYTIKDWKKKTLLTTLDTKDQVLDYLKKQGIFLNKPRRYFNLFNPLGGSTYRVGIKSPRKLVSPSRTGGGKHTNPAIQTPKILTVTVEA